MKILVIGGSYFLGKHFVNLSSKEHEVTVFNRGNKPVFIENVNEIHGDRNNSLDLDKLKNTEFDVVVDFCAYEAGQIKGLFTVLPETVKQYIFVSTVDAYQKGTGKVIDENSPLETKVYGGEVGQYIAGKVNLEKEVLECIKDRNIAYTSIRPVIIYGPDNYAPREGIYFNWIDKAGQVLMPDDSTGSFQLIYVEDLAHIILNLCLNEKYYNLPINVCGEKEYNYDSFLDEMENGLGKSFERVKIPVEDILRKGIPLPFPLTKEESEHYISIHDELKEFYKTPLSEGLLKSYELV